MKQILSRSISLSCVLVSCALAQTPSIEEQVQRGKVGLEMREYDRALEDFSLGLATAREQGDKEAETRVLFYSGLASQKAGEITGDRSKLDAAVESYRQVLELKPDSGSTMVNLAQVLNQLEQSEDAEQLYRQAVRLNDEKRNAYMTAYAKFLKAQGRDRQAMGLYKRVIHEDPSNQAARKAMSAYYLDPSSDWVELKSLLWQMVNRGEVDRSIDMALASLEVRTTPRELEDLLTIITAGLSRSVGLPGVLLESRRVESLRAFSRNDHIGEGVRELFGVYQRLADFDKDSVAPDSGPFDDFELRWWRRGDARNDPDVGLHPRDAMRQLLGSLGDRYAQRDAHSTAEACYKLALGFTPGEPDPVAIRELVNLYARQGDEEKIEEIANRYVFELFEGKGVAYSNSEVEKIYQYHLTLGQIYGHLAEKSGDWGHSGKVDSAIFQLESAKTAGEWLANQYGDQGPDQVYTIDPGLVNRLATAYAATGDQVKSDNLRLEAAEHYDTLGNERAKGYVLEPVRDIELQPVQQQQYQMLVEPRDRAPIVPEAGGIGPDGLTAPSRGGDRRFEITTGESMLNRRDQAVLQRYIESLSGQQQVNPVEQWMESGGRGQLIEIDPEAGTMSLKIEEEIVEIEFDSRR